MNGARASDHGLLHWADEEIKPGEIQQLTHGHADLYELSKRPRTSGLILGHR